MDGRSACRGYFHELDISAHETTLILKISEKKDILSDKYDT